MTAASAVASALAAACPDPYVAVDAVPRVIAWNGGAADLLGWSAEELVGTEPPLLGSAPRALRAAVTGEAEDEPPLVLPWVRRGGTPLVAALDGGAPVRAPDGQVVGWGGRLRPATAPELAEQVVELEERDRMRAERVAGTTHDLQAPLTGLLGFARTLCRLGHALAEEERRAYLEGMERQVRRVAGLVDDFLLGVRLEADDLHPDELEVVDLAAVARDVPGIFGPGAGERVRLAVAATPVRGDRRQLERVLQNLVQNALKYARPATPVAVEVRREGGRAVAEVADEGPGMPDGARDELFAPHARIGPRRSGSAGLGLAIVRRIVEAHGGGVAVDSRAGAGTTVTVSLPLAHGGVEPSPASASKA